MSFQKCPMCEGHGYEKVLWPDQAGEFKEKAVDCRTCQARRIIHTETGLPPSDPVIDAIPKPDMTPEDIVRPMSVLDDYSDDEIMYYHSPYFDELQAIKEQRKKELETKEGEKK